MAFKWKCKWCGTNNDTYGPYKCSNSSCRSHQATYRKWKCGRCGEWNDDNRELCTSCGTWRRGNETLNK